MINKITLYVVILCAPLVLSSCLSTYSPDYDLKTSDEMPKEAALAYLQQLAPVDERVRCGFQLNAMTAKTGGFTRRTTQAQPYSLFNVEAVQPDGHEVSLHIWQDSNVKYSSHGNTCGVSVSNEKEIRNAVTALKSLGVKVP